MSVKDLLNKAGDQSRDATGRVLGNAREQWEDAERRIRAGMRIHPRPNTSVGKSSFAVQPQQTKLSSADPELNHDMSRARAESAEQGKARKGNAA